MLAAKTPTPLPGEPIAKAWAMLFQMMDRIEAAATQRDFAAVHYEDPIASAAVSALLAEPANSGLTKVGWKNFVWDISALHTAADAGDSDQCEQLVGKIAAAFQDLQKKAADPALLEAAQRAADRYTCPMHPEVVGAEGAACPKCGMPLEQRVVLELARAAAGDARSQQAVVATIDTDGPLQVGRPAFAVLHLRRPGGESVLIADLIETHTRKIHLLIVNQTLTDYHHEHPRLTATPGDYFSLSPPANPDRIWPGPISVRYPSVCRSMSPQ